MKVKELLKTVNVAWSPPAQHPILLAAGTAAQQLDASFSTSASLDLYELGLQQPGYEMELKASIPSDHRFHKIIWGPHGNNPAGIIVGGCDYGTIQIYSAAKMLANESNCIISSPNKHTGPVRAMDFNPFQTNLLATGATESEIYIWDVVNSSTPMTPGSRSQPLEDVQHIAWNKQVQHILASTFSQRCVIWDLRKNEPIIKLTDASAKIRWKVVQWHPEVATQLCLASEDDQSPIIELWDLRFATSPLKTLEGHQRGVLSIAWSPHDSDLLLSCAKDNRILCWNPNSNAPNGEVTCELAQTNQWNFDVSWCPRHPGLVVGTSFDGHVAIYSLLGGQQQTSTETSNKIVDSFPGMDPFVQPPPVVQREATIILKKAPKWLKKSSGASFGFGGKLTIFQNEPVDPNVPVNLNKKILVSQVITNPELIRRSNELETALKNEQYNDYCKEKADCAADEHDRKVWYCVGAYFGENVTKQILELLGYNPEAINNKLNQYVPQQEIEAITEGVGALDNGLNGNVMDGSAAFDAIAQQEQHKKSTPVKCIKNALKINTSDDEDGLITQAILLGNIEAAVSLCFSNKRYADAVILSMTGGPDLLARTQYRYFSEHTGALNSLINSLVSEDWADIVKSCDINCWKEALVGVFTHSNLEERSVLCDILGDRLTSCENSVLKNQAQICYICSGNLNKMIEASRGSIQEIVELVTIMRKALELQGIQEVRIEGNIASLLSRYAEMLAAEGNFEAALNYLGNSQEERIIALKDRLCRASGCVQMDTRLAAPRGSISQNYYEQSTKPQQSLQSAYNSSQPTMPTMPTMPTSNWNTAPTKQPYGAASNNFNSSQAVQYGAPSIQSVQPMFHEQYSTSHSYSQMPVAQPPPPPPPTASSNLGGSRPPSVGPQSRSKYLLDPSVQSSSSYGSQTTFSQQSQMYNSQQVSPPIPGFPSQSSFQPQIPVSASSYANQSQSHMFSPQMPEPPKPVQSSIMSPASNVTHSQMYNPVVSQQQLPQAQAYSNENVYQPASQPSGWNDPPVGKTSRPQPVLALYDKNEISAEHAGTRKWKAKHSKNSNIKAKAEFQPQNPILHPLGTASQAEPIPNIMPRDSFYPNSQASYNQQQYGHNISNPGMQFNTSLDSMQRVQPVQTAQAVKAPEPEKPKPSIPEEHVHLKTVLDELKMQCYESAKNPQIKRKIEDVSRKLEVLYDCLRENKLTQNTLNGLHQMSQMIQSGNYTGGLSLHTQLVSGPDFSQIASFMPGIKVLLQSALQLGVYIR